MLKPVVFQPVQDHVKDIEFIGIPHDTQERQCGSRNRGGNRAPIVVPDPGQDRIPLRHRQMLEPSQLRGCLPAVFTVVHDRRIGEVPLLRKLGKAADVMQLPERRRGPLGGSGPIQLRAQLARFRSHASTVVQLQLQQWMQSSPGARVLTHIALELSVNVGQLRGCHQIGSFPVLSTSVGKRRFPCETVGSEN